MKTTVVSPDDLARSVIAVPPLARRSDLTLASDANRALIDFLKAGGVSTFLYGGNANLYHVGLYEYAQILDSLAQWVGADDLAIPSAGPAYGTLIDQAAILRERSFPTVMVLPATSPVTESGLMTGIRHFAERLGKPIVIYVKSETYLSPTALAALIADGIVSFVKYAVVREDPAEDAFLTDLVRRIEPRLIVSGMGEQPALVHMTRFGLQSFTSGLVCLAPAASTALLKAIRAGDTTSAVRIQAEFRELENLRNEMNPIRVLHDALSISGIADMGAILPCLSGLEAGERSRVEGAVNQLMSLHGVPSQ